jgi:hypothetical protein
MKYVSGVMVCSFSPMNGYIWRRRISLLKIRAEAASIKCMRAMKVRELKSHTIIPFLDKGVPLVMFVTHKLIVYLNI